MTIVYFIVLVVTVVLAVVAGYFYAVNSSSKSIASLKEQLNSLSVEKQLTEGKLDACQQKMEDLKASYDRQTEELKSNYAQQMDNMKQNHIRETSQMRSDFDLQRSELREGFVKQMAELRESYDKQMEQQSKLIDEKITTASEKILKERSEQLSSTNREQLAAILNPLNQNLALMKEAVEKSDREQAKSLTQLDTAIRENLKTAREVGERADKLASALTGENKTLGNFGELKLRQLLENAGLEEGVQFEEQVTITDETGKVTLNEDSGKRMIPDVILHFPDDRDVIIDSKLSLVAFQRYFEAETDEEKIKALDDHLKAVRSHFKGLAHKNYSNYIEKGHHKLDFVVMYFSNESALQLALANDPGLWKEAYDQGVVISGSQNLYMMLRILEMSWRQVKQVENQENIMKAANDIVSRVQLFYERFLKVEEQLRKTNESFDKLKTTTSANGQSIVIAARKLLKYGAKESNSRKLSLPSSSDSEDVEDTEE